MFNKFFYQIEDYLVSYKTKVFNLSAYVEYGDYIITNLLMDTGMRITECFVD